MAAIAMGTVRSLLLLSLQMFCFHKPCFQIPELADGAGAADTVAAVAAAIEVAAEADIEDTEEEAAATEEEADGAAPTEPTGPGTTDLTALAHS